MSEFVAAAAAVRFTVLADASPGLLPRLLQPLAKRDLVPDRLVAAREGDALAAEIHVLGIDPALAPLIAGDLGRIVGVRAVRVLGGAEPVRAAEVRRAA